MHKSAAIFQIILVTALLIAGAVLYYKYPAYASRFYPACIFHRLTGFYCPGCGSQRAASALLHGHLASAARYNLLFLLALPVVGYSAFVFTWNVFASRTVSQALYQSPVFVKCILAIVVLFAVLRNIPLEPFSWLAPHA